MAFQLALKWQVTHEEQTWAVLESTTAEHCSNTLKIMRFCYIHINLMLKKSHVATDDYFLEPLFNLVRNAHYNFSELKIMSSDCLFYLTNSSQPTDMQHISI